MKIELLFSVAKELYFFHMKSNILILTLLLNLVLCKSSPDFPIKKEFIEPGNVDALSPFSDNQMLYLIQFDLTC